MVGAQAITGAFSKVATAVAEAEASIQTVQERHTQAARSLWVNGYVKVVGSDHLSTTTAVLNLGAVYKDQGKLKDAARMLNWGLSGLEKAHGIANKRTIETAKQLTALYMRERNLGEAQRVCAKALNGSETTLGKCHEGTLAAVLDMGIIHRDQGQFKESEQMLQRAFDGYQQTNHNLLPLVLNALGTVHALQGNYDKADEEYDWATECLNKKEERDELLNLIVTYNKGNVLQAHGRLEEAEKHCEKALEGFQNFAGHRHLTTM
ncbi:Kinesin light chain, partial [Daldinia childiae]|uniref:Kinesin light chain n=1 Tax=Daldinia childiae TaxID=326645 RepID=UPI00144599C5